MSTEERGGAAAEPEAAQSAANGRSDLEGLLRNPNAVRSPAEKRLADFMIANIQTLPFETGGTIARAVGVSEMSVTRFVRSLGFENLRDLKARLRQTLSETDSDIDDYMARFQMRNSRQQALQESLRLELDAVVNAYTLAGSPQWDEAVDAIVRARTVFVVGFQASKGLAMDFASRLAWARPNVIFVQNNTGTFGEIIGADPRRSLVVLIDTASYAASGLKLAERLKETAMPLVIVTDKFSHWGLAYTPLVFEAHTHVKTFWDSTAGLSVILNLMIDSVAVRLGAKARRHFAQMSDMGSLLGEFIGGSYLRRKD